MTRRFSHDVPSRANTMRRAMVRAYLGNHSYLVAMGDGTAQPAHFSGTSLLARGSTVIASWSNASGCWIIR